MPVFILPLMHHLVQQSLDRLSPPVTANVAPADYDLGTRTRRITVRVMTKPAFHPPGNANWNRREHSTEFLIVQRLMRAPKLLSNSLVIGMITLRRPSRAHWRLFTAMHIVLDQNTSCRVLRGTRSPMHESDDRAQSVLRRVEVSPMQPKVIVRVADEHGSVRREPAAIAAIESQPNQRLAQLLRIAWPTLQPERELRLRPLESEQSL